MGLDLTTYLRKDSGSASNIYYGYALTVGASDSDFSWSIRRVNTAVNVETSTWANNDSTGYIGSWTDRASAFLAPTASLGFTWSIASQSGYYGVFTWSALTGVNKYILTFKNQGGQVLDKTGGVISGPYTLNITYTDFVINQTLWNQRFLTSGTYTVTLTAQNSAGSTSSATTTINL